MLTSLMQSVEEGDRWAVLSGRGNINFDVPKCDLGEGSMHKQASVFLLQYLYTQFYARSFGRHSIHFPADTLLK